MQKYRYEKNGYSLAAIRLIYGVGSPHIEQFSSYALPPHDLYRLKFWEEEQARDPSLGPGINHCTRIVSFGDGRTLSTTLTQGSGINTVIVYHIEMPESLSISSVLFNQKEYEYFDQQWDRQVQHKVNMVAKLVRALDTGDEKIYPILLVDFPEIAQHLLSKKIPVMPRAPLWP